MYVFGLFLERERGGRSEKKEERVVWVYKGRGG